MEKGKKIFLFIMGVLLSLMGLLIWSIPVEARTAKVTYAYSGQGAIAILVSKTPNFVNALKDGQTINGAIDTKHLGYVDIGGLNPGETYYFSAVAWDKEGHRSPFSAILSSKIPAYKGFNVVAYPPLPLDGKSVTITIKLK